MIVASTTRVKRHVIEDLKKAVLTLKRSIDALDAQTACDADPGATSRIRKRNGTRPAKVLLVDDDPESRSILRNELQAAHYDVVTAGNETETLRLAALVQPDLILLNVEERPLDGSDVFKELGNDPATWAIPVIFLTPKEVVGNLAVMLRRGIWPFKNDRVAVLSNELRQAVTVMAGFARLLEQKLTCLEPSLQAAYLQEILQHADRLSDLMDEFQHLIHYPMSADSRTR